MTNVSKKRIATKVSKTIDGQFIKTIARLDVKSAERFFKDFFTATERVMFAKRLAIILLLNENFSPYRIARLLNVSTATVRRVHARPFSKNALLVKNSIGRDQTFFKEFRDFLFEGLSMNPKRRVKWLNEFEKRYG
ncbi:MAG: Trp family transcriptional regulator [Candidatus Paceibacteria bacterium]